MSDLLKQAIADAKAVRATALSNAKAALEEHFAPKLQSMLSEKLKAEVAAEEEGAEEAPLPVADVDVHADAAQDAAVAPAPVEEPALEAPVGDEAPIDGAAPVEEPAPDFAPAVSDEEPVDEETNAMGNVDPVHLHQGIAEGEKASSDYKKDTKGHKTDNKGQEVEKAVSLKTPAQGGKTEGGSRKAVEKWPGESPIKVAAKGGPVKDMHNKAPKTDDKGLEVEKAVSLDTPGGALKENDEVDEASLDEILKELEASVHEVGMEEEGMAGEQCAAPAPAVDEELNLDELLSETDDKDADDDKDEDKDEKKDDDRGDKLPWMKENISLKKELSEYRSAVVYLRDRINEVNLLNAKLLYTNKLFKQTSLTNEQKLKVIESFDLTKSVREAKLVYATLAESFNFGGRKTVEAPVAKKPVSTTVKSITEGLASKQVASTKPTTTAVLTEGAEMANRFKKLAGIRK